MASEVLLIMPPDETDALTQHLQAEGFVVERVVDGADGVERSLAGKFALVIIDASPWSPDGVSGVESLRRIRQRSLLPALMVSAESNDAERILALELGADDYLRKPYLPQELIARARAILRRASAGVSAFTSSRRMMNWPVLPRAATNRRSPN